MLEDIVTGFFLAVAGGGYDCRLVWRLLGSFWLVEIARPWFERDVVGWAVCDSSDVLILVSVTCISGVWKWVDSEPKKKESIQCD